jgi:prepilin-type N-terminal cleavage/methylation domain-containing protein
MKTIGQRGLSILELMVALAIGLIIVLATTGVMMRSEAGKRTTTSTNDMNQVATYLAYTLDRSVRSAGSGSCSAGSRSSVARCTRCAAAAPCCRDPACGRRLSRPCRPVRV